MASENIPFPRTPYPFDQPHTDNFAGLKFVSDWLELPEESEEYYPESNALSPEDWIACNGKEDPTWVVGEPDWLEDGIGNADIIPGKCLEARSTSPSPDTASSPSDLSSPQDSSEDAGHAQDPASEAFHASSTTTDGIALPCAVPSRGVIRRRGSGDEEDGQAPERKRPRLERLKIDRTQELNAPPRVLTPPQVHYDPTPISPVRQFCKILAEKPSKDGVLFKVVWRESWVHESKMPDVEPIRQAQYMQFGEAWDVLPGSSASTSQRR